MKEHFTNTTHEARYAFMMEQAHALGKLALMCIKEGTVQMELKPDNTKVTTVDKELNRVFIEQVARQYPGDLVWGEEDSNSEKGDTTLADRHWMWLIDPIDGTSGFWRSYENRRFTENTSTIMITGFAPGETTPTMSVIHNPFQRQTVTISADTDATYYTTLHAPRPRRVHLPKDQGPATLDQVQRYEHSNWQDCVPNLRDMAQVIPYARLTEHQLFMGSVALGDVDLSAFPGPSNPHDVAPGALIVHNAGGAVRTFNGEKYEDVDWRTFPIAGTVCAANDSLAGAFVTHMQQDAA